jgi:hypothetical protein
MPSTSFEGIMGSGKSLTAATITYTKFYNREMLRFCFYGLKGGKTPSSLLNVMVSEYGLDKKRSEQFLRDAIRELRRGTKDIPRLKIISNMFINIRDETGKILVKKFDTEYFINHCQDLEISDCILIWDETPLLADSRNSASKMNKLVSYFATQVRKRDVELYICTQHIDLIDKRLRRIIDERGTCSYYKEKPCKQCEGLGTVPRKSKDKGVIQVKCPRCLGYGETGWSTTVFFNKRSARKQQITIFGPAVFWLFNTKEFVRFQGKALQIKREDL